MGEDGAGSERLGATGQLERGGGSGLERLCATGQLEAGGGWGMERFCATGRLGCTSCGLLEKERDDLKGLVERQRADIDRLMQEIEKLKTTRRGGGGAGASSAAPLTAGRKKRARDVRAKEVVCTILDVTLPEHPVEVALEQVVHPSQERFDFTADALLSAKALDPETATAEQTSEAITE